jgi:SRSO17 transposase
VEFRTKPQIALAQIEAAVKDCVARGVVLTDPAYGSDGAFRAGVTALGLLYAVGVPTSLCLALRRHAGSAGVARPQRVAPHPVEWLVVEWPEGEAEPTKYWLSTLPEDTPLKDLVDVIKLC